MTRPDFSLFRVHAMSPAQLRRAGAVMLVLGLAIAIVAGAMTWLALSGDTTPLARLVGGRYVRPDVPEIFIGPAVLCGFLCLLGLLATAMGAWQLLFGERLRGLLGAMLVLVALLLVAGMVATAMQGGTMGRAR